MTPRSLVGMTMGARKRRWARDFDAIPQSERASKAVSMLAAYGVFPKQGNPLAQRLRPCPGCAKCGSPVRRFVPVVGWCRPRDWVLWDGAKLWRGGRRWRRPCPITNLRDYSEAADRGTWKELFCDGSGVLPARAKKVRR